MKKRPNSFEEMIAENILEPATTEENTLDSLADPNRDTYTKIAYAMKRIADNNDRCKEVYEEEHYELLDLLNSYHNTQYGNKTLIESVKELTKTKQKAPVVNASVSLSDDDISRIEKTVLQSKPIFDLHIDFNKSRHFIIAMTVLAICEFFLGFGACRFGTLTPAERLAISEYRCLSELGVSAPGYYYENVINRYPMKSKEIRQAVRLHQTRCRQIRQIRSSLSDEYSKKLAETFPEGVEVKNALKTHAGGAGESIYMYCIDRQTTSPFSIFVTPAGSIFLNHDSEQKEVKEITSAELKKNWERINVK